MLTSLSFVLGCATRTANHSPLGPIACERTPDLRSLFKNEEIIRDLEVRGVALISYGGKQIEVVVNESLALDEVIHKYRGAPYDGQVKLVARDAILQTSLVTYDPSKQSRMYVSPGDLIFIQARE
jgi:hypothetical protein